MYNNKRAAAAAIDYESSFAHLACDADFESIYIRLVVRLVETTRTRVWAIESRREDDVVVVVVVVAA